MNNFNIELPFESIVLFSAQHSSESEFELSLSGSDGECDSSGEGRTKKLRLLVADMIDNLGLAGHVQSSFRDLDARLKQAEQDYDQLDQDYKKIDYNINDIRVNFYDAFKPPIKVSQLPTLFIMPPSLFNGGGILFSSSPTNFQL